MATSGPSRLSELLKRPRVEPAHEVIDLCDSEDDAPTAPTPSKRPRLANSPPTSSSPERKDKGKGKAREVIDVDQDEAIGRIPSQASTSSASSLPASTVECPICTLSVPLIEASRARLLNELICPGHPVLSGLSLLSDVHPLPGRPHHRPGQDGRRVRDVLGAHLADRARTLRST